MAHSVDEVIEQAAVTDRTDDESVEQIVVALGELLFARGAGDESLGVDGGALVELALPIGEYVGGVCAGVDCHGGKVLVWGNYLSRSGS